MSNKLEAISKLVDNQTVNSSTLEQLIKDRLNDVGPENYYEAIRLLKTFYHNPILVPDPIPVTNTQYQPYMVVRLRIEFQDHPNYPTVNLFVISLSSLLSLLSLNAVILTRLIPTNHADTEPAN